MVRCKFRCNEVNTRVDNWQNQVDDGDGGKKWVTEKRTLYGAKLTPVYSADPDSENKAFWDATPSGSLEVASIHNGLFVPGKDYYIDISEAPE